MNTESERFPSWTIADGAASLSVSMLIAVLINYFPSLAGLWLLGFLHGLTQRQDGLVAVAALLLLPSTGLVYGGVKVIFAAKYAAERALEKKVAEQVTKQVAERLAEEREKIREQERQRLAQVLEEHGIRLPPEAVQHIAGGSSPGG